MNAPAAIKAVFVDYRRVKGRKCHQLIFEIPSELWPQAYAFLGEPTVDGSDWYAIARLNETAAEPVEALEPKDRRKLADLPPATQAALLCQREAFWRYLREELGYHCNNEPEAADVVRSFCRVASRADIAGNPQALERWHRLLSAFLAWMAEPA